MKTDFKKNKHHNISEIIRIERIKKNYSQLYMAFELNLSQNAYSKIERGATKIHIDRLYEIAKILDIDIRIFFETLSLKEYK